MEKKKKKKNRKKEGNQDDTNRRNDGIQEYLELGIFEEFRAIAGEHDDYDYDTAFKLFITAPEQVITAAREDFTDSRRALRDH